MYACIAVPRIIPMAEKCTLRAASKDQQLEETYLRLLKESSPHEKAITRDLGRYVSFAVDVCNESHQKDSTSSRTFPHHAFFTDGQGIGQENLFNVLKAYSLYVFFMECSRHWPMIQKDTIPPWDIVRAYLLLWPFCF